MVAWWREAKWKGSRVAGPPGPAGLTTLSRPCVVIVSGCPGSGKTTLARWLAASTEKGVHFVSDEIYAFISDPVDPTMPESKKQNTVIMNALAASVREFARGGYTIFLDGVIGPWFLHVFRKPLGGEVPIHYIVLHAPLETCVERVRQREGPGLSPKVDAMWPQFVDLGALAHHAIQTDGRSEAAVRALVLEGLAADAFRLDWTLVAD